MSAILDTLVDVVGLFVGTPLRAVITISALSLGFINFIWYVATKKQGRDVEHHALAMGIVLVASLGLLFGMDAVASASSKSTNDNEPPIDKVNAIEAGLAAPSREQKKLPDKKTRAPEPEQKKEGLIKEKPPEKKEEKKKEEKKEEVKRPPIKKEADPETEIKRRPDPDANPDTRVGPVVTPNLGPPNNNTAGNRAVNTGDPFWARLSTDIHANFSYPAVLETKKIAMGCFYFNADGTPAGWRLIPRSEDDTLDDAVERALKSVDRLRKSNPEPIPNHLLNQATTQWNCFPLGNLKREG
ncbi:MAG: hypothetical protein KF773_04580 [Deltaproteobacteria bacterium]|nr:hypothetical protein [Deltaproteobacteria bacterium]MCW5801034.1 hypothetical protein [Deltaproteobacteria bacterium]